MKRTSLTGYLFVLPAVLVFIAYVAYPLLHTVILSSYTWSPVNPIRSFVGAENFARLLADPNFLIAARNNIYFIILSLAIQLPIALLLAIGLNSSLRHHHLLRTIFFAPFVVPVVAVGLVWQLIYEPNFGAFNGLLDAVGLSSVTAGWLGEPHLAIFAVIAVSCWRYLGFHMMILLAGLQAIPDELYEAARIDGATAWQQLIHIVLPSIRRILLVDALLITVGSVKIFDIVQVMTSGGPGYSSDVLATYMYKSAFTFDQMGYSAAIAVIMLVITLALTVIYVRASNAPASSTPRSSKRGWLMPTGTLLILAAALILVPRPAIITALIFLAKIAAGLAIFTILAMALSNLHERLPRKLTIAIKDATIAVFAAITFLPIAWSLLSALKPHNELLLSPWSLPRHWAWENFAAAWASGVGGFFANSILVTAFSVLVMLALAIPASYAIARIKFVGKPLIFGLVISGLLVPVHAALLPLYEISQKFGISEYWAIIGPYIAFCLPLSVLLLRAYFQEVPSELADAAIIDGAGHLRTLWSIYLPIARPALATVAVFQAAWVWNELLFALVFLEDKAHMTLPVGLLTFQGEHSTNWAVVMAGVAMAIIPVLILYFIFQRHVVKGLTAGAIK